MKKNVKFNALRKHQTYHSMIKPTWINAMPLFRIYRHSLLHVYRVQNVTATN